MASSRDSQATEDIDHMGMKPTCKEVHRLVSEGLDRDLSMLERLRMRLHLTVCDACSRFERQMAVLRRAMRQLTIPDDSEP